MTSQKTSIRPLEQILAYKNQQVLDRFIKMRPEAAADAELIFDDLKRFLWLVATTEEKRKTSANLPDISFSVSMLIMDEMWHAFILFTKFYARFCDEYLGGFVHHPTAMDKYAINKQQMSEEEAITIFLEELASLVYDEFGEETTQRWFDYYFKYPVLMPKSE